jgi:hypothetical protein
VFQLFRISAFDFVISLPRGVGFVAPPGVGPWNAKHIPPGSISAFQRFQPVSIIRANSRNSRRKFQYVSVSVFQYVSF